MADRARVRVASLQRAAIQSLLKSAPLPHPKSFSFPPLLEDRSLSVDPDSHSDPPYSGSLEGLTSTTLAPTLLRPVITPRQLLASHTLKHTFRNPHIGALAKTALDLRESEGVVERALGRCFAAMEWDGRFPNDKGNPDGADDDDGNRDDGEKKGRNDNGDRRRKRKKRKPNGDTDDEQQEEENGEDRGKGSEPNGDRNSDPAHNRNQERNGAESQSIEVGKTDINGTVRNDEEINQPREGKNLESHKQVQGETSTGITDNNDRMDLDDARLGSQQQSSDYSNGLQDPNHSHSHPHAHSRDLDQSQFRAPQAEPSGAGVIIDHESSDAASLSFGTCNPAFSRLEELFITPGGLPISTIDPDQSHDSSNDQNDHHPLGHPHPQNSATTNATTTLLSVGNQRTIVRAALECLHELSSDCREYVERLEEVRNRLASVRRERSETWSALRNWSLDREEFRLGLAGAAGVRDKDGMRIYNGLGANGTGSGHGTADGIGNGNAAMGESGRNGNDGHTSSGNTRTRGKGTARTNSLAAKRK